MKSRLICLLVLALCAAACDRVRSGQQPLRVGMDFTYPPFQMFVKVPPGPEVRPGGVRKEIDGVIWEMDGVSVRLADALAKDLGRPLEIVAIPFREIIPALQAGKIDLAVASLSITDQRREKIDFSDPYVQTGLGMLVRSNSAIKTLEDLRKPGRRAIVRQSTSSHEFLKTRMPDIQLEVTQESGVAERKVMDDPDVAFINDQLMLWRMHRRMPGRTRVLPMLLREESWGIGIRKGDETMRRQVNGFLAKFRAEGGFHQLSDRYLTDAQKFLASQGLPPLFP